MWVFMMFYCHDLFSIFGPLDFNSSVVGITAAVSLRQVEKHTAVNFI